MKILMTGATGMIGSDLGQKLTDLGHSIVVVARDKAKAMQDLTFSAEVIECDLGTTALSAVHYSGVDAIVNLAGESIDGRWSPDKKKKIIQSRVQLSKNLMKNCPASVKSIVAASAIGIYGDRGEEELTEQSLSGQGFLADVCREWENTFSRVHQRVVILRFGMVLSKKGGALKKLIPLFQKNLGAALGSGQQWMSYISLDDLVLLIVESLQNDKFVGVFNATNSNPIRNQEFTTQLCRVLQSIQLPAVPAAVLKVILGEMSDLVLFSTKVSSDRLKELGFEFKDKTLMDILHREANVTKNKYSSFYAEQYIPYDIESVFDFFSNHANLEKITPDILNFQTEKISTARVEKDTLIDYKLKIRGLPIKWRTLIKSWDRPYEFVDTQLRGPYAYWRHTHKFKKVKDGTLMIDEVQYKVPLGGLGRFVAGSFVAADVEKIFAHRRKVIAVNNFNENT